LRRRNQYDHAGRVAGANVNFCENKHWPDDTSRSYRALADVNSSAGSPVLASLYYEKALKLARSIQQRDVLIQALLAHGRFLAKTSDVSQAFSDLNEALAYCVESGYRIYEADVRVALCWAYLATNEKQKAKDSAERAKQMSNEIGYYWGKVDAEEVLSLIARSNIESKPPRRAKSTKTGKSPKSKSKRRSNPK
jgi:tetratricopeptide (TPR) repeat protein